MGIEVIDGPAALKSTTTYGALQKEHFDCISECFTMADKYNFNFPSLNEDFNAVFLAAIQFIDMMYFEMNYPLWGISRI